MNRLLACGVLVSFMAACSGPSSGGGGGGGGGTQGGTGGGSAAGGSAAGGSSAGGTSNGGGVSTGGGTATGGGTTAGGGGNGGGGNGGGTGVGGGGTGPLPLTSLCSAWATAYCDREANCSFLDSAQNMTCLARVTTRCSTYVREVNDTLYAYDPAVGGACVAATAANECAQGRGFNGGGVSFTFGNGPTECNALLTAAGTAGTPCTAVDQCVAGTYCPVGPGVTACQVCTAAAAAGQPCAAGIPCATGTTCFAAGGGSSVCTGYLAVGQICTPQLPPCDPTTSQNCPLGLPDGGLVDGGMRACLAKVADGMPCNNAAACSSGLCNDGNRTDAGIRTCGVIAIGSPCGNANDCGPTAFCDGLRGMAMPPGLCAPRIALGSTCTIQRQGDPNDGCADAGNCFDGKCTGHSNQQANGSQCRSAFTDCFAASYCPTPPPNDGGYNVCTRQVGAGSPCTQTVDCQTGLRCDQASMLCVALMSAGGPCAANNGCKDALVCPQRDAGNGLFACAPLSDPGADCSVQGVTCASGMNEGSNGYCSADAGVCAAPGMVGDPCAANNQCGSNRCLLGDGGAASMTAPGSCAASCLP